MAQEKKTVHVPGGPPQVFGRVNTAYTPGGTQPARHADTTTAPGADFTNNDNYTISREYLQSESYGELLETFREDHISSVTMGSSGESVTMTRTVNGRVKRSEYDRGKPEYDIVMEAFTAAEHDPARFRRNGNTIRFSRVADKAHSRMEPAPTQGTPVQKNITAAELRLGDTIIQDGDPALTITGIDTSVSLDRQEILTITVEERDYPLELQGKTPLEIQRLE